MEEDAGPQIIDIAAFKSGGENEGKKTLTTTDQMDLRLGLGTCCFAGANDELVVSASNRSNLYFWYVSNYGRLDTAIAANQPRRLHQGDQMITATGYSKQRSTMISCATTGEIAVWNPFKLPQKPHSN